MILSLTKLCGEKGREYLLMASGLRIQASDRVSMWGIRVETARGHIVEFSSYLLRLSACEIFNSEG